MNIYRLVLEVSELCNASCPACMRMDENDKIQEDLKEGYRTTAQDFDLWIKNSEELFANLERIDFTGRFADAMTNRNILQIVRRFRAVNPYATINIQTNGSVGAVNTYRRLGADPNVKIQFAIDGTDHETNVKYRRGTKFDTIMKNAQAFIDAGGWAEWIFLVFDHNEHQVAGLETLVKSLGFKFIAVRKSHRFNIDNGQLVPQGNNVIKIYPPKNSKWLHNKYQEILTNQKMAVRCAAHDRGYVYISPRGVVLPCYQYAEVLFPNQPAIYNTPGVQEILSVMQSHNESLDTLTIKDTRSLSSILAESKFLNYIADQAAARTLDYMECREKCLVNVDKFSGDYYGWEYKRLATDKSHVA